MNSCHRKNRDKKEKKRKIGTIQIKGWPESQIELLILKPISSLMCDSKDEWTFFEKVHGGPFSVQPKPLKTQRVLDTGNLEWVAEEFGAGQ